MIAATLEKGSICYLKDTRKGVLIKPGEQLISTEGSDLPVVRKVNTRLYTAWKDNLFCFEEQHLDQIMSTLARWYDFDVYYQDTEVKNYHFTAWFRRNASIAEVIEVLEKTKKIKMKLDGKTLIVQKKSIQ